MIPTQQTFDVNQYDFTEESKKQLLQAQKQHQKEIDIHSNPILPDDVDEYGNLPYLRCGWKACGKLFYSRDDLMEHIKDCIPHVFVDRLHVNCKNILTADPDMSLIEFMQKVRDCYDNHTQQFIHDNVLIAYYHKFQPLCKKHQFEKGDTKLTASQKEIVEILFNYKIQAEKLKMEEQDKHPGLPDMVDEYGNLPKLRCGWSKCGKEFNSKKELIQHVKECVPFTFMDRFHTNCKATLEMNPELTLSEFTETIKGCYDESMAENIVEQQIIDYYNYFQPLFMKHKVEKGNSKMSLADKEKAEILFKYRVKSQKKLIEENHIPDEFTQ